MVARQRVLPVRPALVASQHPAVLLARRPIDRESQPVSPETARRRR